MAIGKTTRGTEKKGAGAAGGVQQQRGVSQGDSFSVGHVKEVKSAAKRNRPLKS